MVEFDINKKKENQVLEGPQKNLLQSVEGIKP